MPDEDKTPKYQEVAAAIRERIRAGHYPPGASLPSEPAFAREFGVHVNTIRQTFAQLRIEGVIVTEPNRGSYVRPTAVISRLTPDRYRVSAEIAAGLREPDPAPPNADPEDERRQDTTTADAHLAYLFGSPVVEGSPVVRRWTLLKMFGRPRLDITAYYPADVLAAANYPPEANSFDVLHAAGIDILRLRGSERIRARMPDADESKLLGIVGVGPLLVVTRKFVYDGRVVEVAREIRYPADQVEFEYEFDMGALA